MTGLQQQICIYLFEGAYIVQASPRYYRLLDTTRYPLRSFRYITFKAIAPYLRKTKKKTFVIDLRKVRAARKNSGIYKYYQKLKSQKTQNNNFLLMPLMIRE